MKKKIFANIFVWLIVLVSYLPILYIVAMSFTDNRGILGWSGFSFQLYVDLFQNQELMLAVGNTLLIGVISSLLATVLGTTAAIGIHSMKKLPKAIVSSLNQITVINAEIVTAAAFMIFFWRILAPIINAYEVEAMSYIVLIICHTVITTPFVILNVMPKLSQINPNTYEAALDLGAKPSKALWSVLVPQLVPGMISGFIIALTLSMDDFIVTQYNYEYGNPVYTISTYVYNKAKVQGIPPEVRALSTIIFVVILAALIVVNIVGKRKQQKEAK